MPLAKQGAHPATASNQYVVYKINVARRVLQPPTRQSACIIQQHAETERVIRCPVPLVAKGRQKLDCPTEIVELRPRRLSILQPYACASRKVMKPSNASCNPVALMSGLERSVLIFRIETLRYSLRRRTCGQIPRRRPLPRTPPPQRAYSESPVMDAVLAE